LLFHEQAKAAADELVIVGQEDADFPHRRLTRERDEPAAPL
jgi:hypothetical protein